MPLQVRPRDTCTCMTLCRYRSPWGYTCMNLCCYRSGLETRYTCMTLCRYRSDLETRYICMTLCCYRSDQVIRYTCMTLCCYRSDQVTRYTCMTLCRYRSGQETHYTCLSTRWFKIHHVSSSLSSARITLRVLETRELTAYCVFYVEYGQKQRGLMARVVLLTG